MFLAASESVIATDTGLLKQMNFQLQKHFHYSRGLKPKGECELMSTNIQLVFDRAQHQKYPDTKTHFDDTSLLHSPVVI